MHRYLSFLSAAALLVLALPTHAQQPAAPDSKPDIDPAHPEKMQAGLNLFKSHVRQILTKNCVDCHGGDEVQSGLDLATRKGLVRGGAHGPAIVPGKSADSNVVRFISHKEKPYMPEGSDKLAPDQIAAIGQWIDLGAPYDKPLVDNPRDPDSWVNTVVPDKAKEFWAFRPLANVQPPQVKNETWIRNPIDHFVLAKLEEKQLTPNAVAEPRVLLRRAHFDLIGLPPETADAKDYESLIDKLLNSQHYGERWGRHWLDAARFAESHGFEQDYDRPYAYHFRDFVIEALNQDMPYDQFVRWQLAGDEYEPDNPLALKATGFLGAGVFPTQITANEVERTRYDALDDMAATVGSAMLGLSVGCARCHDHKFDPIPQADYYRLVSTFTTTVRSDLDVNLEPGSYKIAKAAYDKEHQPFVDDLKKFESEQLPGRLAEWEKTDSAGVLSQSPWVVLDVANLKSNGGATLARQDDGSVLVSGTNPDTDWFTFSAKTNVPRVAAIRVEALPDPSLPKNGSGRGAEGNFLLTDFKLRAKTVKDEAAVPVKLTKARATAETKTQSAAAAIDENETSGWGIDPKVGKSQAAVFELAEPLPAEGSVTLTFQLDFKKNKQLALGRFRVSACSADVSPPLESGSGVPESVVRTLGKPIEKWSKEESAALLAWYRHHDTAWQKLSAVVAEHAKQEPQPKLLKIMVCSEGVTPIRHHTQGADFFNETFFLKRGDCDQKMGTAEQSFLQVLMTTPEREKHWQVAPPDGSKTSYRRRSLSNWITDTQSGAGHLLARVIVNRLWQHHFGRGIVETVNDFGVQGSRPTHPELLDWLAGELIRDGWRLKPIHKLIMTSAAYMQSSRFTAENAKIDPENVWLWRRSPQRLEAEIIRDSLLAVSGKLDRTLYGPGTLDEGHMRRSIYFQIKRSKLVPMMQLFDQPEPLVSVGNRPSTTIAPQALALLNNTHIRDDARAFASLLIPAYAQSPTDAVKQAYVRTIARPPDDEELTSSLTFLSIQEKSYAASEQPKAIELALTDFCQVLFGLNEFVYVD